MLVFWIMVPVADMLLYWLAGRGLAWLSSLMGLHVAAPLSVLAAVALIGMAGLAFLLGVLRHETGRGRE